MLRRTLILIVAAGLCPVAPASAEEPPLCFGEPATIDAHGQGVVRGTPGRDVIIYGNEVYGGGGDDLICTFKGFDYISGGPGNDKIDGGDNQDTLDGGPGDDQLTGSGSGYSAVPGGETLSYESAPGPVTVNLLTGVATGNGTDTFGTFSGIIGSDHDDTLIGGAAWNGNFIRGEGGNDVIYGYGGISDSGDFLAGGDGNDKLYGKGGHDKLRGDAGDDLLDGGNNSKDWGDIATYEPPVYFNYPGAASGITVKLATGTVTGEGTDTLVGIEQLVPTIHADVLWGTRGPDSLTGGAGDDVIRGWGGSDSLGDGPGKDSLYGGWGPDYLWVKDGEAGDLADGQGGRDVCTHDRDDFVVNC